ncbi:MAG: hypothetical protein IPJ19_04215 [Planctomycetes bacterium]|nr:hypothetical protein [Planctomycetota bacterium]
MQSPEADAKSAPQAPAESSAVAEGLGPDEARSSIQRSAHWLLGNQHPDGSWGTGAIDSLQFTNFSVETYYAFQLAANALAFCALDSLDDTPERRASLEKSLGWLLSTRLPKRGSDWDVDCSWPAVYGLQALVVAARDPRLATPSRKAAIQERGMEFYALLEHNQEPKGGWGYYEGPAVSQRPTWSTSFTTSAALVALLGAQKLGWKVDEKVVARAVRYLDECKLPTGAYTYDHSPIPWVGGESINDVKGSLGRMQAANLALRRAGDKSITDERIRKALESFFTEHKFLDVGRMRPIPHEAYYYVAAYFYFFGHAYCGQVIDELPEAEREAWHQKLRAHVVKVQWKDGSSIDFPNMSCMQIAGTAFSILALQAGVAGHSSL